MRRARLHEATVPATIGLGLLAVSLATRPLIPIDETRYASVAWEMWLRGDWLVPYLNGAPYSHKPPLLFWLVDLGFGLLGPRDAWVRMVPALFTLGSLFLAVQVARRLWPENREPAALVPWILLGTGLWALFGTVAFFDPLLAFFTLLAAGGVLLAAGQRRVGGWTVFGIALGLGILSKGPVILLHTLPAALLAPWWAGTHVRWRRASWYAGAGAALAVGIVVALAWAVPAALAGGDAYRAEILWGQTADRVVQSFAHRRPVWFYLLFLPVVLAPWSLWPPLYLSLSRLARRGLDPGVRFCLSWTVPGLVLLSLVSGKQPQYLLPLLPGAALLFARGVSLLPGTRKRVDRVPTALALGLVGVALVAVSLGAGVEHLPGGAREIPAWTGLILIVGAVGVLLPRPGSAAREVVCLACASAFFLAVLHVGVVLPATRSQDLRGIARFLHRAQEEGRPLAHAGNYEGQYQFLGRLTRPIEEVERSRLMEWARGHPGGKVVVYVRGSGLGGSAEPDYVQPYRGQTVTVWSSESLLAAGASGVPGWE